MTKEGQRYQTFSRRAFLLAGAQGALMLGLGARLYYLSVTNSERYKLQADKNRMSLRLIAPKRGEILDRKGRKIATNKQDFRVFLVPERTEDIEKTLSKVKKIIPISPRQQRQINRAIKRQRKFVPVTVAKGLSWDEFARVNVEIPDLEGIIPDAGMTRDYPYAALAAHIIGYVGRPREQDLKIDPLLRLPGFKLGREGLERRYENQLRGKSGNRNVEVNAYGREIRELDHRLEATEGENLHLTLDMKLQEITAKSLGEEAAAAVVMDANTGEILSLASSPSYDPNEFNLGISVENWNAILKDPRKPLLNKAVAGQYPPGSTVKMIVALAALEKGLITEKTTVHCSGKHKYGDRDYHCWEKKGHARVDLMTALQKSCDVYFYKLAEKLDIDDLATVCRRFGLGEAFDIGVEGTRKGLVPTKAWKKKALGINWYQGETLNVSIGQGAMTATPLQLAVMTARLATGKMITPILVREKGAKPNQNNAAAVEANPRYLRMMNEGMHAVMKPGGTGHDYRNPKDSARIAGKTGTAQVRRISKKERLKGVLKNEVLAWKERDHALFVGYAPYDAPKYVTAVLVQHGGGGGSVAAPIGRKLLTEIDQILAEPVKSKETGKGAGNG